MAALGMDMITQRPRTPRDPYTTLTEKQIQRIPKDPGAFFMFSKPDKPYPETGWHRDRYATRTSGNLLRNTARNTSLCWIDEQWQRQPPQLHNTCRLGATERWGPDKIGNRTVQHFNKAEDPNRFVNTELYRRQPTNIPGPINMAHGRPAEGYYALRNPNSKTWFGSSVPLNRTQVLQDINPKTKAEYEIISSANEQRIKDRKGKFPFYSEYTDKFGAHSKVEPILTTLQRRKMYLEES